MAELTIENASFSYDGKTDIFTDLNYTITTDQVFCILGPNGIGKSTLLKSLMNLHPLRTVSYTHLDVYKRQIDICEIGTLLCMIFRIILR